MEAICISLRHKFNYCSYILTKHFLYHFQLEKCESLYWSSLPGVPRKVKWPVKVAEWSDNEKPVVYCRSDNA